MHAVTLVPFYDVNPFKELGVHAIEFTIKGKSFSKLRLACRRPDASLLALKH